MTALATSRRPWPRFDPDLRELRAAAVAMVAVLGSWASALLLEHVTGIAIVLVVAVVLPVTLSRTQRDSDGRRRLVALVALPLIAAVSVEVGRVMVRHPDVGELLFAVAVSGSIWVRRFGPRVARAGGLVALPFIALLVTPVPPDQAAGAGALGGALVALIAIVWVNGTQLAAIRLRLLERPVALGTGRGGAGAGGAAGQPSAAGPAGGATQARPAAAPATTTPRRLPASSRMALQMAVALGIAFALGRWLFPAHVSWVVLTAFIVCSGNRGREEVAHKSGLRIAGAAVGTIAATLLSGLFPVGDPASVAVIFAVLAVATWLRAASYAYWAGSVTAVLSLLYGYYGEAAGASVLSERLLAIGVGAAVGVAVSWLLLPVRTSDVLRRWTGESLAALSDLLATLGDPDAPDGAIARAAGRFERTVERLRQLHGPLRSHRAAVRLRNGHEPPYPADVVEALERILPHVRAVVAAAPEAAGLDRRALGRLRQATGAARRGLAGRGDGERPADPPGATADPHLAALQQQLAALVTLCSGLGARYAPRRPPEPPRDDGSRSASV